MSVFNNRVKSPILEAINTNFISFINNIKSCFHVVNLSSVFFCYALYVHKLNSNVKCENKIFFSKRVKFT